MLDWNMQSKKDFFINEVESFDVDHSTKENLLEFLKKDYSWLTLTLLKSPSLHHFLEMNDISKLKWWLDLTQLSLWDIRQYPRYWTLWTLLPTIFRDWFIYDDSNEIGCNIKINTDVKDFLLSSQSKYLDHNNETFSCNRTAEYFIKALNHAHWIQWIMLDDWESKAFIKQHEYSSAIFFHNWSWCKFWQTSDYHFYMAMTWFHRNEDEFGVMKDLFSWVENCNIVNGYKYIKVSEQIQINEFWDNLDKWILEEIRSMVYPLANEKLNF